jgi:hypothetical protein
MFNGSPDSAVPAIFLRVSTYGAAVGANQRKFSSSAELYLNLATYRAYRRYAAIIVECRHLRQRYLLRISAGKKLLFFAI